MGLSPDRGVPSVEGALRRWFVGHWFPTEDELLRIATIRHVPAWGVVSVCVYYQQEQLMARVWVEDQQEGPLAHLR